MAYTSSKTIYAILIVFATALFLFILLRATYSGRFLSYAANGEPVSISKVLVPPQAPAVPASPSNASISLGSTTLTSSRLTIPSIGVNAAIEDVGLTTYGDMDTPLRLADVGLYEYGPQPGDLGSAVIDGHVDNALALPAVFYNLKNVKEGADIYVTDSSGKKLHFVVTAINDYALATAPVNSIFNDTSGHLLKLITCQATTDSGAFAYDHRIVVTAELV